MIPLDFDRYCRAVRQAEVEFILTRPSVEPWWHDFIQTPSVAVQYGADGGASIADGVVSDGSYVLIGRHHTSDTEIVVNGHRLNSDDFMLLPKRGSFIFACNGPRSWLAITVPRDRVESLWNNRIDCRRPCLIPVTPEKRSAFIRHAESLWTSTRRLPDEPRAANAAAMLADLVVDVVARHPVDRPPPKTDDFRALEVTHRALAILRTEDLVGEWYIDDLANAVGVHSRTLLRCFNKVLRMGPVRYLRYRQLNLIRRHLLSANANTTVTGVMQSVGASDMGRVSGEYKALFGETPSQTLRVARQTPRCTTQCLTPTRYPGRIADAAARPLRGTG